MKRRTYFKIHKWLAIFGGSLVILWAISGVWIFLPADVPLFDPKLGAREAPPTPDASVHTVSPAQAVAILQEEIDAPVTVRQVQLQDIEGELYYQFNTSQGRHFRSARTGQAYSLSREEAEAILRRRWRLAEVELGYTLLEGDGDFRYFGGLGYPVHLFYRVDKPSTAYVMSPRDGTIAPTSRLRRINQGIGALHTLVPVRNLAGRTVQHWSLILGGLLTVLVSATGYLLLFPNLGRRKRRRAPDNA
jgi:hypothetical protein